MKRLVLILAWIVFLLLAGCTGRDTVSGEPAWKLTLVKPEAVTIRQGGMAKADIRIQRENVLGDVAIRFSNLPRGVDVVERNSKIVGDRGSYTLRASDGAVLVENFSADVTATARSGRVSVSQTIDIHVRARQ